MRGGGVVAYPTDSFYALGCLQGATDGLERMRRLRGLAESHNFALLCYDLKQIGSYAQIDKAAFRVIKANIPGAYTFVLKAGKNVEKRLHHPARKTVAFRAPAHPVALALLQAAGEAIVTTTLRLANDEEPIAHDFLRERLKGKVDLILEAGACQMQPSAVLDFTESPPRLLREGGGDNAEIFPAEL